MEFSLELTIYDWLLIAILALNLHWVLAVRLSRVRGFGGLNIGNWGPVIMIRTNRWLGLIDRLSGPKGSGGSPSPPGYPSSSWGCSRFSPSSS